VPEQQKEGESRGLPEALRDAIERTFAATADSAAGAGGRAQEMLDEVSRRGQKARDAASDAASGVIEAIEGMRLATREDVRALEKQLQSLSERVGRLESKSKVEG
jgi:polyhydroxyalkanoate synthesis regulator phasin